MHEYEYRVREGTLSAALLRPVHPIHADIADNLSSKMISHADDARSWRSCWGSSSARRSGSCRGRWRPSSRPSPLAFVLRFLVEWTLALAAFWTTRVSALNQTYYVALLFLSGPGGAAVALPRRSCRRSALALPFRWMIAFPVELLLGQPDAGADADRFRGAGGLDRRGAGPGALRLAGRRAAATRRWAHEHAAAAVDLLPGRRDGRGRLPGQLRHPALPVAAGAGDGAGRAGGRLHLHRHARRLAAGRGRGAGGRVHPGGRA